MKFLAGLTALTLAAPGLAHAANIGGTYGIKFTTLCQSIENEVFNKNSNGSTTTIIETIDEGKISQTIGTITFTPTKAGGLSGNVSATFTQTKGTLTILGLPGNPPSQPASPHVPDMKVQTKSQTGTYSLTLNGTAPATLSLNFGKGSVSTFTAYLSKLSGGAYTHADFIGIDGNTGEAPSCSNSGSLDHN
jgi:hypothetical protein